MFISASAKIFSSDVINMFTSDLTYIFISASANMFPSDLANMFTSDLANMFTSDLANMFTIDLASMFTSDLANMFASDLANMITSDWPTCSTSDLANMFTSELEKCKKMIWPRCSLVKLTGEYVGLVPGIRHLILEGINVTPNSESGPSRYHVCQFSGKTNNFHLFGTNLEIQETNVGIRISIFEIQCVQIFRQNGKL